MIYCLFGSDEFRAQARLEQLEAEAKKLASSLDYSLVTANKCEPGELAEAIAAQSLIASRKFLVIKNAITEGTPELQAWLGQQLAKLAADEAVTVIFWETQLPPITNSLGRQLTSYLIETYQPLTLTQTKSWLQAQLRDRHLRLTAPAIDYLLTNFSGDLRRLGNELDKLVLFSPDQTIDRSLAAQLAVPTLDDNIFSMIDALAQRDLSRANQMMNAQLARGKSESELLAMMAYQFRNILRVKSLASQQLPLAQIVSQTGLQLWMVRKNLGFAAKFTVPQLQRIFYLLQRVDTAMKQGRTPPKVGLDILTVQIVSG